MKKAFNWIINRLNTGEERINKLEGRATEVAQTEMQQEKKKKDRTSKNCGKVSKDITYVKWNARGGEREKSRKRQGVIIAKFSKINDRQHYRFRKLRE